MTLRYETLSLLSDYGHADEFVGVVHSVVRSISAVEIIDITHNIPAFDIRAGGLAIARAAQFLRPGVVVAVVDPGAGTERRAVAVEVGDGQSVLVGPDNGLLAPAVALVGGATRAVELTNTDLHLAEGDAVIDAGRDVFAPVAAHLCNGVPFEDLGTIIDANTLQPGVLPVSEREGDMLTCEVLWVDRFGNVQLNVDADDVADMGSDLLVRTDAATRGVRRVSSFGEITGGSIGLMVDSYGLMALAVARGSAANELSIAEGARVTFEAGDAPRQVTPVELGRRG